MAHPVYEKLYYKYLHLYTGFDRSINKPENKEWQMYITSLTKYATSINEGYCTLRINKNYVCMVHILRMMCDACFEGYRLLLVNDKDAYLRKYLYGEGNKDLNKFRCGNEQVTTTFIKKKMAEEYDDAMGKVYELSNRFIHPSNFFYRDYSLNGNRVIKHSPEELYGDYTELKGNVESIDGLMDALNQVLLDILKKLVECIESVKQLPYIMDLSKGCKVTKNPNYKG